MGRLFLLPLCLLMLGFVLPAAATDLRCYQLCMAQPAGNSSVCGERCSREETPENVMPELVIDQPCFARCLSLSRSDAACRQECVQKDASGNPRYVQPLPNYQQPIYQQPYAQQPAYVQPMAQQPMAGSASAGQAPMGAAFSGVDFGCFKACRNSGEPLESCQMLCAP